MTRTRRAFLAETSGCAAYLATAPWGGGWAERFAAVPRGQVVAASDFCRIERLSEGVWAVISTPLARGGGHFATTANGGILAGRDGVLVIEGFMSDAGAAWVRDQARALTGHDPSLVVVTHFHADHCRGLAALVADRGATTMATATTQRLIGDSDEPLVPAEALADEGVTSFDLGDREVRVTGRKGHTPSDATVEIQEPAVIWCGDLVWNGMFPNFTHSIPSQMIRHCERILGRPGVIYVPGHGSLADADTLVPYLGLLREVEAAARRAIGAGTPIEEAAAQFVLPASLGEWIRFSSDYYERAFAAWERELTKSGIDPVVDSA